MGKQMRFQLWGTYNDSEGKPYDSLVTAADALYLIDETWLGLVPSVGRGGRLRFWILDTSTGEVIDDTDWPLGSTRTQER